MSFFQSFAWTAISFLLFTALVAIISAWKTRDDKLDTAEGYFLPDAVCRASSLQVPCC